MMIDGGRMKDYQIIKCKDLDNFIRFLIDVNLHNQFKLSYKNSAL